MRQLAGTEQPSATVGADGGQVRTSVAPDGMEGRPAGMAGRPDGKDIEAHTLNMIAILTNKPKKRPAAARKGSRKAPKVLSGPETASEGGETTGATTPAKKTKKQPTASKTPAGTQTPAKKTNKQPTASKTPAGKHLAYPGVPKERANPVHVNGMVIYTDMNAQKWRVKRCDERKDKALSFKSEAPENWAKLCKYVRAG